MSKLDRWIDHKVTQNVFVWLLLFLILMATIQTDNRMVSAFFGLLLLAPAVYLNNLVILPLFKRRRALFLILFLVNAFVFTGVSVFVIWKSLEQDFRWELYVNFFGIMFLALVFASAMKIARDSFTRRQQEKEAELKLLKAQLNPHFLFNTLNNLYGLSVVKSEKLPSLMLKLSDLLRYSLYETKELLVPLQRELAYIENYISLEKIRLEDQTEIIFLNKAANSSMKIAPMLLIVFVENAFKHLEMAGKNDSRVKITVEEKEGALYFECSNTFNPIKKETENLEAGRSGIGLQNVKKRLALIYPDKHQLECTQEEDLYSVHLIITN